MNENKSEISISTVAQLSSVALIAFYVLGFIVVNSCLINFGVYSFNILNAQYLAAGVIFGAAGGIFGFVVGRRIYFLEHDFSEFASLGLKYRYPKIWALFCLVYVYVEVTFGVVVGAFWTASLLFDDTRGLNNLLILLTVAFLIDYLILWRGGVYKNHPLVALPITFIGFHIIIFSAIILVPDIRMYSLYIYYFTAGMVLNIVIDVSHRRMGNILFTAFWGILTLITAAAIFGNVFYGEVKRQYGGGKPFPVQFVVSEGFPTYLANVLKVENGLTAEANILGETNSEFLIQAGVVDQQISLRISRTLIDAVVPVRSKKKPEIPDILKKLTK